MAVLTLVGSMVGVAGPLNVLGPEVWTSEDHVSSSPNTIFLSVGRGANIHSYNPWPPLILKAHRVKCIPLVPELDTNSCTAFPPWNKIKVSPPIEATRQKLRMDGPDLGGCSLFMRAAWQRRELVMRTPLSWRDQAQSPGIAMKYSIVFTHCNLITRKRREKRGCKCCCSWDLPSSLTWTGCPGARKWGARERPT